MLTLQCVIVALLSFATYRNSQLILANGCQSSMKEIAWNIVTSHTILNIHCIRESVQYPMHFNFTKQAVSRADSCIYAVQNQSQNYILICNDSFIAGYTARLLFSVGLIYSSLQIGRCTGHFKAVGTI